MLVFNPAPALGDWTTISVTVYPAGAKGSVEPIQTIAGPNTKLNSPVGIAINPVNSDTPANFSSPKGLGRINLHAQ